MFKKIFKIFCWVNFCWMSPPRTEILATLLKILFDASPPNQNPGYAPVLYIYIYTRIYKNLYSIYIIYAIRSLYVRILHTLHTHLAYICSSCKDCSILYIEQKLVVIKLSCFVHTYVPLILSSRCKSIYTLHSTFSYQLLKFTINLQP